MHPTTNPWTVTVTLHAACLRDGHTLTTGQFYSSLAFDDNISLVPGSSKTTKVRWINLYGRQCNQSSKATRNRAKNFTHTQTHKTKYALRSKKLLRWTDHWVASSQTHSSNAKWNTVTHKDTHAIQGSNSSTTCYPALKSRVLPGRNICLITNAQKWNLNILKDRLWISAIFLIVK